MQISRINLHGIWQQVFQQRQRKILQLPWLKSKLGLRLEWEEIKGKRRHSQNVGPFQVFIHSLTLAKMRAGKCLTYALNGGECAFYSGNHLAWDLCILTARPVLHTHSPLKLPQLPLSPELALLLSENLFPGRDINGARKLSLPLVGLPGFPLFKACHSHALRNTDLCSPHWTAAPETRSSKRTVIICIWQERQPYKLRGSGHGNVKVRVWMRQAQQTEGQSQWRRILIIDGWYLSTIEK